MATILRLSLLVVLLSFACAEFTEDSTEEYYDYYQEGFNGPYKTLSVCIDDDGNLFTTNETDCSERIAIGKFRNAINQTGWSFLEVETSGDFEPEIQAYAAGVVEGILTRELITYQWRNTREDYCTGFEGYCRRLHDYLHKNMVWLRSQLIAKPRNDLYWNQVNLTLTQMTGISHGYEDKPLVPEVSFDVSKVLVLNAAGEFFDLETVLNRTKDVPPSDGTEGEDHCTGLVKITPGNKDLLFAQVAMNKLNTMTRVLKLIKMGYDKTQVPGHTSAFSSYPGSLTSFDDFSLMSSGIGNVETTHKIYNTSLYDHVNPEGQISCWLRNVVANKLAHTAKEWAKIFARYNSGTYNNQWTIVDYKTFTPGKELPSKGVLHVLEQIPGTVLHKDMTWYLKMKSYWLSYNIPYFPKIREMTGAVAQAKKVGAWSDFDNAPRAKIARRDLHKVVDIDTMTKFMRYNDYQHDPLSLCSEYQTKCNPPYSAEAAMSARGDLNLPNGTYELTGQGFQNHAGLDYKGTNAEMMKNLRFRAWSGPTYDPLPPFNWKTTKIPGKHFGMPDEWKFDYVDVEWETPVETKLD